MPSSITYGLGLASLAATAGLLYPKLEFAGAFRTVTPFNNERCIKVETLQACEDAWVHAESGLAYLACSSPKSRHAWTPATLHLNATALPAVSQDYIATYDFNSGAINKLTLVGLPAEAEGIYVHAIEITPDAADPEKLTVLLNSHRLPKDRASSAEVGASSVFEIFETRVGAKELQWVQTVKHELIRTPNNMVATGPRTFYFSNDHARKVHWSRKFEALHGEPSDLVYCDATIASNPVCKVVATGLTFPNGMARGPGSTIYSASTLAGDVRVWEIQDDNGLVLIDQYVVPRPIDNIVVDSETGNIFVTTLPKILDFMGAGQNVEQTGYPTAAVEIWKISNDTSDQKFFGGSKRVEIVFADDGKLASAATVAASYKNKLLVSGLFSRHITVCDI